MTAVDDLHPLDVSPVPSVTTASDDDEYEAAAAVVTTPTTSMPFRVGHKVEAVDERDPRWVHVATVVHVMGKPPGSVVVVALDGKPAERQFKSRTPHPLLVPVGYVGSHRFLLMHACRTCETYGLLLQGPEDALEFTTTPKPFSWGEYLKQSTAGAAPRECFGALGDFRYETFRRVVRIDGLPVPAAPPLPAAGTKKHLTLPSASSSSVALAQSASSATISTVLTTDSSSSSSSSHGMSASSSTATLVAAATGGVDGDMGKMLLSCQQCVQKRHFCNICFAVVQPEETQWSCRAHEHTFCKPCLQTFIVTLVECNDGGRIRCPMNFDCGSLLRKPVIEAVLEPSELIKWREQAEGKIDPTTWYIRCPQPNCGYPVIIKDLKLYDQAKCNNCRLAMQFSKKQRSKIERLMHNTDISTEDLREKVYLVLNTKPCPRCAIPIERDGGCDHMTCNRCQSSFCWQCGKIMRSSSKLLFGSHCDRLQLFGCPEKFCKENRAACYAARSALFVGKVTVAVVAGPPVIVCAALFYTGPKFLIENVQMMRRRRQREQAQRSRAMAQ